MENIFTRSGLIGKKVERRNEQGRILYAVILESNYDTDLHDLWDALTNKERLPRWFGKVDGNFHLNGKYKIEGNAEGTITRCDKLEGFDLTWEFAGDVSWVKVNISEQSETETRLRLEHLAYAEGEHFKQYGPGATGVGWALAIAGLTHILETNEPVPGEHELLPSAAYRSFISDCANQWGEATISAGFDRELSSAAARNTEKFYLGE